MNWRLLKTVQLKCEEKTINFDTEIKLTVDRVKVHLLRCKERAEEDWQSTSADILCSDLGSVTAHLQSKHQEVAEDVNPWTEYSLLDEETVKLDLDGTPSVDHRP